MLAIEAVITAFISIFGGILLGIVFWKAAGVLYLENFYIMISV